MSQEGRTYRCSAAARWLPRVLAGAVLAAAMIASWPRPDAVPPPPRLLQPLVVVLGAAFALWVVRKGSVLRREIDLGVDGLTFRIGRHERVLDYVDVRRIDGRGPFEGVLHWVPAVVLIDVFEKAWDVPVALEDGPAFLDDLLDAAGDDELQAWAEARGLRGRMERAGWFVPSGYVAAAVLVAGAVGMYLR